jgi:hypothetical protein
MTGGCTDAVQVPAFEQASSLLGKIGTPCFNVFAQAADNNPADKHYNAWFALRRVAEIMLANRRTRLRPGDREMMFAALRVAHELAHDNDVHGEPPIEVCHCRVSEQIRDLAELLAGDR